MKAMGTNRELVQLRKEYSKQEAQRKAEAAAKRSQILSYFYPVFLVMAIVPFGRPCNPFRKSFCLVVVDLLLFVCRMMGGLGHQ